jgi:hypothetical protein
VPVSLVYKVVCKLLSIPRVLLRSEATKDAELLVLRHENAVLRRQINGRVRYEPVGRFWLAALSGLIPRYRCRRVFLATPGTLLALYVPETSSVLVRESERCSGARRSTVTVEDPSPRCRRDLADTSMVRCCCDCPTWP